MKVKLKDVAEKANVSIATVSRILNNHPVSAKARENVLKAIAELDYRPDLTARGLIKGQSYRIGVIVSNMENPYYSSIMNSMEEEFRKEGYLCNFASSSNRGTEEIEIIRRFMDSGVDGIIIVEVGYKGENTRLYSTVNEQIPVILINGDPKNVDINLVHVAQDHGMKLVMDHLFEKEHKHILFVGGSKNGYALESKEEVYKEMMRERGLKVTEDMIIKIDDIDHYNTIETAFELFYTILSRKNRPTAIFTSNEIIALGIFNAAKKLNLKIPEELAIVGHDNTFISKLTEPTLTTVDMHIHQLGVESALMLMQLLKNKSARSKRLTLFPDLIIRGSS